MNIKWSFRISIQLSAVSYQILSPPNFFHIAYYHQLLTNNSFYYLWRGWELKADR